MSFEKIWFPFSQEALELKKVTIEYGKDEFLYDTNNKEYVDLISSWWINLHGHSNQKINQAIELQSKRLDHVMFADFSHPQAEDFIQKIDKATGEIFGKFFYSDNGSTAIESAIKMSKQFFLNKGIQKDIIISFNGGYHGDTLGAMSVGRNSGFFTPFQSWMPDFEFIDYPEIWDGIENQEEIENKSLNQLKYTIESKKNKISSIIIEPIFQGAAGMKMCSPLFLDKVIEICKKEEIIVIFDEVMTGFYRTGKFFAYQYLKNSPDILCLSKGISGGVLPLALTCVKSFIHQAFISPLMEKTFLHGHSYTANPIAIAAANASIDILFEDKTLNKINEIESLYQELIDLFKSKSYIEKIRKMGTIFAFSIKGDHAYGSSLSRKMKFVFLENGLNLRPIGNCVYFLPPYCISRDNLRKNMIKTLEILDKILQ